MTARPGLLLHTLIVAAFAAGLTACPGDVPDDAGTADDAGDDAGPDDGGQPGDAGACGGDGGDAEPDALELDVSQSGTINAEDDQDSVHLLTTGGQPYRIVLTRPACSVLEGHLTVIDDGRDGDFGGQDFAQISTAGPTGDGQTVELEFLAMRAGHYAVVRDARNVGMAGGAGGPDHAYVLRVESLNLADVIVSDIAFPSTLSGTLPHTGAMHVYRFSADAFEDVVFDLSAGGDLDARLVVVAETTGDWIARNDDRVGSVDPLIDAPMTEAGTLYLVVDSVAPAATDLSYTIAASKP